MPEIIDRWGAVLLDASLAATALSGLVVLAMVQCRQPARRRGWARAGLVSMLALLPLAAFNPFQRIELHRPLRAILSDDLVDDPWFGRPSPRDPASIQVGPALPENGKPGARESRKESEARSPSGRLRQLARGLVILYLAGLTVGLGFLALGIWGTSLLIRRSSKPSEGSSALYSRLVSTSRMARPKLRVCSRAGRPVLLGFARPAILIPPELDCPEAADRLAMSLMHEMAHAEASDPLFGLAANLTQAVWFFLPPVWWIRDQMRLDQEFLADRRAVESFGTSSQYASSLVGLARSRSPEQAVPLAVRENPSNPIMGSSLSQRVLMLLRCPFAIERQAPLWWRMGAALTLGLATVGASCLTIRGLADRRPSTRPSGAESSRSFELARLDIGPTPADSPPFDFRFRLPDRFNLTLEIMAEATDLPAIELLGHPLGSPLESRMVVNAGPSWHRVRILRSEGSEKVEVDGNPMIVPPGLGKRHTWLTIRPAPNRFIRIRDLELTW